MHNSHLHAPVVCVDTCDDKHMTASTYHKTKRKNKKTQMKKNSYNQKQTT